MKKLLAILAAAVLVAGCEVDNVRRMTIDNIFVTPNVWSDYKVDGYFNHSFADIPMPELTSRVINEGMFFTYLKTYDGNVLVQEGEGLAVYGNGWSYTINCEYSVGNMRITLRTSDFSRFIPSERLDFRTIIIY